MRRFFRFTVSFLALALLLSLGLAVGVRAQDQTPAADTLITVETLGVGMPSDSPDKAILLLRVTIQPGGAFPAHIHPGALVIAVQSGDFSFTVIDGEAELTRAMAGGTPEPMVRLAKGQEVVAHAGDEIFEQAGVVHTARNSGDTPAIVLVAGLVDPAQPFLQPVSDPGMDDMATPSA